MDMTILNIALPEMAAELRPTSAQQLWIVDIYSLVLAGLLIPWAALADRVGRRRLLVTGYAIFALASLLVLVADSAEAVIAIRALLGIGGAMIMPNTLSLIRIIFTNPRERATALSIWAAVSGLGAAVGPLVGGLLLQYFDWHAAFLVNIPLMVAAIIGAVLFVPESRVKNPGRWDVLGAALALVGMVALVWSIKTFGKEASLAVPEAWLAFGLAAVTLGWFVRRSLTSSAPLVDLRLFSSRTLSAGIVAALGSTFSMIAALLLLAQWLQLVEGATPIEAGIKLMPIAAAGALASLAAPPLAARFSPRGVLAGALAVAGAGLASIALGGDQLSYPLVAFALTLVGAGTGALAIASAMIMLGSPEDKAGNAGALEETSYELGAVLGVAILGSISALVYRLDLRASDAYAALSGADAGLAAGAEESLGAAVAIAEASSSPQFAAAAAESFTDSLQVAGVIGGAIMLVVALAVFLTVPRGTTLEGAAH
ncbi:MAG: MFS transporter [Dermabacter sp.]|nr:MFS transporter [Dermabacter sp.]